MKAEDVGVLQHCCCLCLCSRLLDMSILCDTFGHSWTLSDMLEYFQILSDTFRYSGILWDTVGHFRILSDTLRHSRTILDTLRSWMVSNGQILLNGLVTIRYTLGPLPIKWFSTFASFQTSNVHLIEADSVYKWSQTQTFRQKVGLHPNCKHCVWILSKFIIVSFWKCLFSAMARPWKGSFTLKLSLP